MKQLILLAAMLVLAACSKDEPAATAQEESAAGEQPAADAVVEEAVEAAPDAVEETLVVVEESAAVEEDADDEPIVLAVADTNAADVREWKYKEGTHYTRLIPTQPTVGPADKIEVAELYMYSCPACYRLEPYINRWADNKDAGVRFVRIPAQFNRIAMLHGQVYYTQEVLARNGVLKDGKGLHDAVFDEFHRRGNRLTSESAIARLFERFGVSNDDFTKVWRSFEVNQKMRVGSDLARRYNVQSVPTIVVNGKYRTSAVDAGGYEELIELIDELTVREGLR